MWFSNYSRFRILRKLRKTCWNCISGRGGSGAGCNFQSGASGLTPNLAGALAYILGLITGVLFLVLEPYKRDPFVRFHAMQSVLYSGAVIVFSIAWRIMVSILSDINPWLALATFPIRLLFSLAFFSLWLFVMYQAHSGREYRIPFIGGFAAKQVGKATALAS